MWIQKTITLKQRQRGFHLITSELLNQLPELQGYTVGLAHIFIKHTSASLTINENADSSVRDDFESFFSDVVSESKSYFTHTYEGSDDMPAHLKGSILGFELTIPVHNGALDLGVWQGVYLCEHRNQAGPRQLVITIHGE